MASSSECYSLSYKGGRNGLCPSWCVPHICPILHPQKGVPPCDPYSQWTGGSLGRCGRNTKKTELFKKAEANWSPVSQPAEWQGGMKMVKGAWIVYYNLWHLAILPEFLLSLLSLQKSHVSLLLCICHSP